MPFAVVIDLQGEAGKTAREAWRLLEEKAELYYLSSRSPGPHIALEGGIHGDPEVLLEILRDVAKSHGPFRMEENGLGIFVRETPVLYVRWRQNGALQSLRESLTRELARAICEKRIEKYEPVNDWVAKTTLAFHDTRNEQLPSTLKILAPLDFHQTFPADRLTLLEYAEEKGETFVSSVPLAPKS